MKYLEYFEENTCECDIIIRKELETAGIKAVAIGEVPGMLHPPVGTFGQLVGRIGSWTFWRTAHRWMAEAPHGKGVPKHRAKKFDDEWADEVYKGGDLRKPSFECHTVDLYTIDTQDGLCALVKFIKECDNYIKFANRFFQ